MHDYQRTLLREKFLSALAASVNDGGGVFCDESHVNKFNTSHDFAHMHISLSKALSSHFIIGLLRKQRHRSL